MARIRYLARSDIASLGITMAEVLDTVDAMFRAKGAGLAQMPPKIDIHPSGDGFIHAMPAYLPPVGTAGVKWISGFPSNRGRGLPYISGLIVLNDPDTGLPTAVMDATWITAMRTGAATAVAAKHLARPDSRTVSIVACGVQGRSNLEALQCVFPIERVLAYDTDTPAAERFAEDVAGRAGVTVEVVETLEDAISGGDIVVTSGPILRHPTPTIPAGWLRPGAFACPLDFDSYWTGDAMRAADRFVTDDIAQFEHFRALGFFTDTPSAHADLGAIVAGTAPGRQHEGEITMAMNLGLALADVAVGALALERARAAKSGTELEL